MHVLLSSERGDGVFPKPQTLIFSGIRAPFALLFFRGPVVFSRVEGWWSYWNLTLLTLQYDSCRKQRVVFCRSLESVKFAGLT